MKKKIIFVVVCLAVLVMAGVFFLGKNEKPQNENEVVSDEQKEQEETQTNEDEVIGKAESENTDETSNQTTEEGYELIESEKITVSIDGTNSEDSETEDNTLKGRGEVQTDSNETSNDEGDAEQTDAIELPVVPLK